MTKEKELIIAFDDFEIRTNSLYQVVPKPDPDAPSGFIELGTTKLPSVGIEETIPCRFIESKANTGKGVFDTGLYAGSPMYATRSEQEVKAILEKLHKYIVKPYEATYGEKTLDHKNEEFWDNYGVKLKDKRMFNTANASDLLDLIIAMNTYSLAPKSGLGDPKYNRASYCIIDNEKARSIKEERANIFMDAASTFGVLLKHDKPLLIAILRFSNIAGVTKEANDNNLRTIFHDWLSSDHENPKLFLKYCDLADSDRGKDKLMIYSKLWDLQINRKVTKDTTGSIMFQNEILGKDLRSSAEMLVDKPDLENTKIAILES